MSFVQCKLALPQAFLYPQLPHSKVAYAPYPGPAANSYRRRRVRKETQSVVKREVLTEGLQPNPLSRCFNHPPELGLPRAQGHRLLGWSTSA